MLKAYRDHAAERTVLGLPPLPLNAEQTATLSKLLKRPPAGKGHPLVDLLENRIPAGVDDAAKIKSAFLPHIPNKRAGGMCWAAKSRRSSSTPPRTPARCRLIVTFPP